LSGMQSSMNRT